MNDVYGSVLRQIFDRYGRETLADPRRVEALLRDMLGCQPGKHERAIKVLMIALAERIPDDLQKAQQDPLRVTMVARLSTRLQDNRALTQDAAEWAVKTWKAALGISDESGSPPGTLSESLPKMPVVSRATLTRQTVPSRKTSERAGTAEETARPTPADPTARREEADTNQGRARPATPPSRRRGRRVLRLAFVLLLLGVLGAILVVKVPSLPDRLESSFRECLAWASSLRKGMKKLPESPAAKGRSPSGSAISGQLNSPLAISPFTIEQAQEFQQQTAAYLGQPVHLTNSIGMKLVLIPAGQFLMGSADSAKDADEKPQHRVRITRHFHLGLFPVTQSEYRHVMGTNPSQFAAEGDLPVENVPWIDAHTFCQRLSALPEEKNSGRSYTLPTEAQWEHACRAGTTTRWFFGDDQGLLDEYAWFEGNSEHRTHPVGQKKPNPWGLHDMYGNVWQWCADWYEEKYYDRSPAENPPGPDGGIFRVLRGGCWSQEPSRVRSGYRNSCAPDYLFKEAGFRVVCNL